MVLVGLTHSVPAHGAVVMATMPTTTQLVRWGVDGARPTRAALLATVLALAGVVTVSGVLLAPAGASPTSLGDAITYAGTLGWIAYTRGAARLPDLDALEYGALTALASWPLLLLVAVVGTLAAWTPVPSVADLAVSWHALLYIGLVPSVLAVTLYNHGMRTLGLVAGAAFLNFVPVSAVLMSAALGKPPAAHELAGVALVVGGLLIHAWAPARRHPARCVASTRMIRC
jgi:drug/metabolite transporter (DMT)-like permease